MVKRLYYCQDHGFLRKMEEERYSLVAPDCEYYSLRRGRNVDPLYGEPVNDPLYGGSSDRGTPSRSNESWYFYPNVSDGDSLLVFQASIVYEQMDNRQPGVREEGETIEYDALVYFSRNAWECAIKGTSIEDEAPKEGDVMYLYEEWWDITKVGKGGYILNSTEHVGFKAEVRKRTQFTPERKV